MFAQSFLASPGAEGGGLQADKLLEGNIWQRLFQPSNKQFLCSVMKGYFKVKINDLFAQ